MHSVNIQYAIYELQALFYSTLMRRIQVKNIITLISVIYCYKSGEYYIVRGAGVVKFA